MRPLTLRILLCLILVVGVNANPVTYQQVDQKAQNPTNKNSAPQSTASGTLPTDNPTPDFVHLSDGRIVPYGPGIICTADCVESEVADAPQLAGLPLVKGLSPWLWAVPVAATGIVICTVLCGNSNTQVSPPVLDTNTPPIINPTPPPAADVPEPATIVLLSLGLAGIAHTRYRQHKIRS